MKKLLILAILALTTVTASASYYNPLNSPAYDAGYSRGIIAGQKGELESFVYTGDTFYNTGYSDGYEDGYKASVNRW